MKFRSDLILFCFLVGLASATSFYLAKLRTEVSFYERDLVRCVVVDKTQDQLPKAVKP